nr:hypothetical protein 9 [Legionellales bacterium]
MSREASTDERTEEIILNLNEPNIQALVYLEVEIDGSWTVVEDIDFRNGIDWTEAGKKEKFNNFSLTPLPGTIQFKVVNSDGKYFPGSGNSLAGVFDLDTRVRLNAGYVLDSGAASSESLNLNDISGTYVKSYFYRTEHSGGTVIIDPDGTGTPTHFANLFDAEYGDAEYDVGEYTPAGYTVQTYDSTWPGITQFNSFTITANVNKGTVYYRTFDDYLLLDNSESTNWISAGTLINGTQTYDFTDIEFERFIQIAVVYDDIAWADSPVISDITVNILSRFENLYTSVYYLDKVKFTDPKVPQYPIINCSGRDVFKRAIGVDIKYSEVNGLDIDDIIKNLCDQVGIPYTADSIADLSSFASRVTISEGNDNLVKAEKLLDQCMQIINSTGYVMYTEYDSTEDDNVLYVQPRPVLSETLGAFNYKYYESIGDVSKNPGRYLQRLTVLTENQVTDKEIQLDSQVLSSTGDKTFSWLTTAGGEAEYKRIEVSAPDNITISNLSVEPTQLTFTVDSITGSVTVTVYGHEFSSTSPAYEGEAIDWNNMANNNGLTARIENPLLVSDAEAQDVAESYISQFGTPIFEAKSLKWPYLNLMPEINDGYLLWRRFVGGTSADDIYLTTKAEHHYDNKNHWTTFNLDDSGNNYSDLGDFVYDDVMDWDKGYVWDMGISTPLSTDAEIDASSVTLMEKIKTLSFT